MPGYVERPGADEYAEHYATYVARVPTGDLVALLERQILETTALLRGPLAARADHAYAPGKWTVKQVVGHMADTERVLSCRALRFARADATPLPPFDENAYADTAGSADRSLESLLEELRAVRASTVALFRGLPPGTWERRGLASGQPVSVRALACIIAGHELHHRAILQERYPAGEATSAG
jgi:hypothetical protein